MGRIIMGYWDCPYCGTQGNPGSEKICSGCGKPRDSNVRFYMRDKKYIPQRDEKNISRSPDWICPYCDSLNPAETNVCLRCGAQKDSQTKNYLEHVKNENAKKSKKKSDIDQTYTDSHPGNSSIFYDSDVDFANHQTTDTQNSLNTGDANTFPPYVSDENKCLKSRFPKIDSKKFALISICVALIFLIGFVLIPKTHIVQVTDISWERSIIVESYEWVTHSDWDLPAGARLISKNYEWRRTDHVLDHYETKTRQVSEQVLDHYDTIVTGYRDLGNGYFEETTTQSPVYRTEYRTETYEEPVYKDVPIYDYKYTYEIEEWVYNRTHSSAAHDNSPYWNEPSLAQNEREQGRLEKYYIDGTDLSNQKKRTFDLPFNEWQNIDIGDELTIKKHLLRNDEIIPSI